MPYNARVVAGRSVQAAGVQAPAACRGACGRSPSVQHPRRPPQAPPRSLGRARSLSLSESGQRGGPPCGGQVRLGRSLPPRSLAAGAPCLPPSLRLRPPAGWGGAGCPDALPGTIHAAWDAFELLAGGRSPAARAPMAPACRRPPQEPRRLRPATLPHILPNQEAMAPK